MGQHRGSGRGPHTIEHASHLDAADAARAVALRRDRLVGRQRSGYDPRRQAEIDMLGEDWRLYRRFDDERLATVPLGPGELVVRGFVVHRTKPVNKLYCAAGFLWSARTHTLGDVPCVHFPAESIERSAKAED